MLKGLSAFAALVIAGCATQSAPPYLVDGADARKVNCSGHTWNWSACVEKASALCTTSGYIVVAQKEEWAPGTPVSDSGGSDTPASPGVARSLLIKCNKATA
jgi:hypothetical protein